MDSLDAIDNTLTDLITRAEALNEKDSPQRSRELSLTITKLEEARHWLAEALLAPRVRADAGPGAAPVEREAGILR